MDRLATVGKRIGVLNLIALIKACEAGEILALSVLKREFGIRGNRQKVLDTARAALSAVATW